MGKLDGKVAVITGGASGIGEGSVRLFVAEGARVVIADVQEKLGKPLAEELGASAAFLKTDVTREPEVKAAVECALETYGRLDCMFNNAGIPGVGGPIEEIDVEGFDQSIAVLLRGVFLGMKHAAPVMKKQGSGSIISTASIAGLPGGAGAHVYSAAKAAVIQLTKSVALELGESGVRVNCICPGFIPTPIFGKALGVPEEELEKSVSVIEDLAPKLQPIPRAGRPADIANAAAWLAGDDSTFVNGHALTVDGGLIVGRNWSETQKRLQALGNALGVK